MNIPREITINVNVRDSAKMEAFMATVTELLTAIDTKTDNMAVKVGESRDDLVEIKKLIAALMANADPAVAAKAQAILDKISGVDSNLSTLETDLEQTGKGGTV